MRIVCSTIHYLVQVVVTYTYTRVRPYHRGTCHRAKERGHRADVCLKGKKIIQSSTHSPAVLDSEPLHDEAVKRGRRVSRAFHVHALVHVRLHGVRGAYLPLHAEPLLAFRCRAKNSTTTTNSSSSSGGERQEGVVERKIRDG